MTTPPKKKRARPGNILRTAYAEAAEPIAAERETWRAIRGGSWLILRSAGHWIAAADGIDRLWNAAGLMWGLIAAGWGIGQAPWTVAVLIPVWAWAALRAAAAPPPDKIEKKGKGDAGAAEDDAEAVVEPPTDAEFITAVAELIGTRNGVLLRDIVELYHETGVDPAWGIPEVRAICTRLGIPVRDRLNTRSGLSVGVHGEAFRAALSTLAEPLTNPPPEPPVDPSADPSPDPPHGGRPKRRLWRR
ncbi:hypothetical protein [Streptomyces sp. NPDC051561]|uniref:hypothetical protein n=1 Tax=Streptomyces sp. NPDC051561 TaxID=3365658 RepID=UPI0037945113